MSEPRWSASLTAGEQRAVRSLIDHAERADGVAPVGEQVMRDLGRQRSHHLIVPGRGDEILGYLNLTPDATAELVVDPRARRGGIGAGLARAAIDRSGDRVRFWAHGTRLPASQTARSLGLSAVRELLQMRRSLGELPDLVVPEGIAIGTYSGEGDHAEILRVNNAAFSWHPEQGGWGVGELAERLAEPWFEPEGLLLARERQTPEKLLGFHWTKVHHGSLGEVLGEVYVLGVDPAAQGRGLGAALTVAGLRHLAQRLDSTRDPEVMLYVEADNTAAVTTYRKLGFETTGIDTVYQRR